jgi:hypothetical protein
MMNKQLWTFGVCAALALAFASSRTSAADADHTTYLTFSQPVALPGVSLGAGTYIFEIPESKTSWDVVRVTSQDRRRVYYSGITQSVSRPAGQTGREHVSFGEAGAGLAAPITVWYRHGELMGRKFAYPESR